MIPWCCRNSLVLFLAVVLTAAFRSTAPSAMAQAPTVTRWMDPEGRGRALHDVPAPQGTLHLTFDRSSPFADAARASSTNRICVVIHADLLPGTGDGLTNYLSDLSADGYTPQLYIYSGGSAEELRDHLVSLYEEPASLVGAILIGDLPHIVYEMMQNWGGGGGDEYEDFPCDIFLMDLNGTWQDTNQTPPFASGKYDTRGGDQDLEIWVARLKADNLSSLGEETALINNYFDKNHRYRMRELRPFRRAFLYNDDDWADMMPEDAEVIGFNYGDDHLRVVRDPENTMADDYKNHMTNAYELMFIRSHGYPGGHGFYRNSRADFDYIYTGDYLQLTPPVLFYSFFVCSGCDFTTGNNLGSLAVMNTNDSGLAAWGSTKTGGIWGDRYFYEPLAEHESLGTAFVRWFNEVQSIYPSYAPPWWYGMVILGDGALRLCEEQPSSTQQAWSQGQPALSFTTLQGASYEVRRTDSLATPNWTNVSGELVATNYTEYFVDTHPFDSLAFYRVVMQASSNLLKNTSFEVSGTTDSAARYWENTNGYTHGGLWGSAARVSWRYHQGGAEAAIRGSWSGNDFGGWWQEAEALDGKVYRANAWFWADRIENSWTATVQELKIEFYDADFHLLNSSGIGLSDVGEIWTQKTVRATSPANTSWVRFVVNVTGASSSGALQLDQVSLTEEP